MSTIDQLDEATAELDDAPQTEAEAAWKPAPRPIPAREMPKPGAVLCARYLLEYPLGSGGNAVVFAASDLGNDAEPSVPARVALKLVRSDLHCADIATERLKREFRLAQVLSHPNIVHVHELDCDDGRWFMTMELLEGDTLAALLKASREGVDGRQAMKVLRACGDALTYAHEHGVIHGDLKPANIFITRTGEVRVLDFGTATCTGADQARHRPAASAHYASPEVSSGLRPDHRDDVFSFACIAYELFSGRHPFGRPPLSARAQGLQPVRAWNLTDRQWYPLEAALSFDRSKRPASVRSLCNELFSREIAASLPAEVLPAAAPLIEAPMVHANPFGEERSSMSPLGIAAIAAALLLTGIAVYSQLDRHPDWMPRTQAKVGGTIQQLRQRVEGAPEPPVTEQQPAPARAEPTGAVTASPQPPAQAELPPAASPPAVKPARTRIAAADTAAAAAAPIFVSFQSGRVTVSEGADAAVIMLKRDASMIGRTFVHWRVVPGTATAGQDFVADAGGLAEFADNQPLRAIYVPLLRDDIRERPEEFFVELYDAGPQTRIWPVSRAAVTIQDDD